MSGSLRNLAERNVESDYTHLREAATAIQNKENERAIEILRRIGALDERNPEDLKTLLFLKPLLGRLGLQAMRTGNLYLASNLGVDQIELFGLMASLPLVNLPGTSANSILLRSMDGMPEVCLIDVGIGSGQQLARLLGSVPLLDRPPDRITVIGIEPSEQSLHDAELALKREAQNHGLHLTFIPIHGCAETLSRTTWDEIGRREEPKLLNAAFALHHVRSDAKNRVLNELRGIESETFVLTEPDSDHETADLETRFRHAWHHFGLVFQVIDGIDAPETRKSALKRQFFAREIEDILGGNEESRSERHESGPMWASRLRSAGFELKNERVPDQSWERSGTEIRIVQRQDNQALAFRGSPLVSIFSCL